jgi:porphobilinogen synthase
MTNSNNFSPPSYPTTRMRRNRLNDWNRRLVAEHTLGTDDLIWPVFVHDREVPREPIPSLPGVSRLSIEALLEDVVKAEELGIPLIAIFPVIEDSLKSPNGDEALNPDNLICRAIRTVKATSSGIGIMTDVALDPFTTHGHDGLLENGHIENDSTLEVLAQQALNQARAGCDIIAPSDMMDGRVGKIRKSLDSENFKNTRILAYAAKYASSLYGPFRDAVGSAPNLGSGDKKTYQMNPANTDEALREVALDINEGADMVMIKPGLFYIDVVHRIKTTFKMPTFVYQVSGEYAMIKAASDKGWLDGKSIMHEAMLSFKRAGADAILTYAALEIAAKIRAQEQ